MIDNDKRVFYTDENFTEAFVISEAQAKANGIYREPGIIYLELEKEFHLNVLSSYSFNMNDSVIQVTDDQIKDIVTFLNGYNENWNVRSIWLETHRRGSSIRSCYLENHEINRKGLESLGIQPESVPFSMGCDDEEYILIDHRGEAFYFNDELEETDFFDNLVKIMFYQDQCIKDKDASQIEGVAKAEDLSVSEFYALLQYGYSDPNELQLLNSKDRRLTLDVGDSYIYRFATNAKGNGTKKEYISFSLIEVKSLSSQQEEVKLHYEYFSEVEEDGEKKSKLTKENTIYLDLRHKYDHNTERVFSQGKLGDTVFKEIGIIQDFNNFLQKETEFSFKYNLNITRENRRTTDFSILTKTDFVVGEVFIEYNNDENSSNSYYSFNEKTTPVFKAMVSIPYYDILDVEIVTLSENSYLSIIVDRKEEPVVLNVHEDSVETVKFYALLKKQILKEKNEIPF